MARADGPEKNCRGNTDQTAEGVGEKFERHLISGLKVRARFYFWARAVSIEGEIKSIVGCLAKRQTVQFWGTNLAGARSNVAAP